VERASSALTTSGDDRVVDALRILVGRVATLPSSATVTSGTAGLGGLSEPRSCDGAGTVTELLDLIDKEGGAHGQVQAQRRSGPARRRPCPDRENWSAWAAEQTRPLAVDLFAGGGGLSLGLEDAGFRVALAADYDRWAVQTHAANFRGLAEQLDLSDPTIEQRLVDLLKQADVALIAGGPPCQPFSRAGRSGIRALVEEGRRAAYDDRRDLWRVWLRIVLAVRPRAVMLENVPDMALGDDLTVVRLIVNALQEAGYQTHLDIVEAPEYGVPQHRQRLILVALRDQQRPFAWPAPVGRVSIWDAISDLRRSAKASARRVALPQAQADPVPGAGTRRRPGPGQVRGLRPRHPRGT